jgi:hypothetical protein
MRVRAPEPVCAARVDRTRLDVAGGAVAAGPLALLDRPPDRQRLA